MVFFFHFYHLLADDLEVLMVFFVSLRVFGSDIRLAKGHQCLEVVASIEEQAPYCRIRDDILCYNDRAGAHSNHFLDELHLFILREAQALEYLYYHFPSEELVSVESPPYFLIKSLGRRFAYVMQKGCPAEPKVIGMFGDIVHHLQRMPKVVLMSLSLLFVDPL